MPWGGCGAVVRTCAGGWLRARDHNPEHMRKVCPVHAMLKTLQQWALPAAAAAAAVLHPALLGGRLQERQHADVAPHTCAPGLALVRRLVADVAVALRGAPQATTHMSGTAARPASCSTQHQANCCTATASKLLHCCSKQNVATCSKQTAAPRQLLHLMLRATRAAAVIQAATTPQVAPHLGAVLRIAGGLLLLGQYGALEGVHRAVGAAVGVVPGRYLMGGAGVAAAGTR